MGHKNDGIPRDKHQLNEILQAWRTWYWEYCWYTRWWPGSGVGDWFPQPLVIRTVHISEESHTSYERRSWLSTEFLVLLTTLPALALTCPRLRYHRRLTGVTQPTEEVGALVYKKCLKRRWTNLPFLQMRTMVNYRVTCSGSAAKWQCHTAPTPTLPTSTAGRTLSTTSRGRRSWDREFNRSGRDSSSGELRRGRRKG